MYIKTKSGDYVNSKNISGLRIFCNEGLFHVLDTASVMMLNLASTSVVRRKLRKRI